MGWYGIEWVIPIYGVVVLLTPIIGFIIFQRRIKRRASTKPRAYAGYLAVVIMPPMLYALFFLILVGLEDLFDAALISETLARSVLVLTALGLAIWLVSAIIFGLTVMFIRIPPLPADANQP
jgi:hypothetical protein